MTTDTITHWIASNLTITAPLVALLASWVLYGVLGKRLLGADDDYWPRIRGWVLPKLDVLAARSSLYTETTAHQREYVGYVTATSLDALERHLEELRYHRNPLASWKTSPEGLPSDGSWAKRHGRFRRLGDRLAAYTTDGPVLASLTGYAGRALGRFMQALGDILAVRQDHVTLFIADPGVLSHSSGVIVHVYAHREFNSLNPATALLHYHGQGVDVDGGVAAVRRDLLERASHTPLVFTTAPAADAERADPIADA